MCTLVCKMRRYYISNNLLFEYMLQNLFWNVWNSLNARWYYNRNPFIKTICLTIKKNIILNLYKIIIHIKIIVIY